MKLQYFGHLMRRVDSLEKTLMLGGIGGRRRRGRHRMRWLDGITDSMDVPQLSYPFICWWTSRLLPCLAIINSAAMNIGLHVSLSILVSSVCEWPPMPRALNHSRTMQPYLRAPMPRVTLSANSYRCTDLQVHKHLTGKTWNISGALEVEPKRVEGLWLVPQLNHIRSWLLSPG